jgi:hypothetical protein
MSARDTMDVLTLFGVLLAFDDASRRTLTHTVRKWERSP